MILGMGVPELVFILVVVVIIFGPKNLPKLGSALGKTVKNVREGMEEKEPKKVETSTADEQQSSHMSEAGTVTEAEDVIETVEAPASTSKFCTHCGTENPADAGFCKNCGAKLD